MIPLHEKARHTSAFHDGRGSVWQFCRVPQGAAYAPAAGQYCSNMVWGEMISRGEVTVFMDDVNLGAHSPEEMLHLFVQATDRAVSARFPIKPEKVQVGFNRIEALGKIIVGKEIAPTRSTINAIDRYERPKTVKQMKRGLLSPLTDLLKEDCN
ncbi:MAG: hypothetical protein MHM6MM_009694 [Cercozoa sp. M6MM]